MSDRSSSREEKDDPSGRDETEAERLDRNLSELLQELRVALPGVQVLFAFLLAVPFQQGFKEITTFQEKADFASMLLTAISAVLLISPSAYHRMTFRMQQKDDLVFLANKLAIAGLTFLALAMTGDAHVAAVVSPGNHPRIPIEERPYPLRRLAEQFHAEGPQPECEQCDDRV